MVPPGYFIQLEVPGGTTGKLVKCPTDEDGQGYYSAGWLSFSDVRVQAAGPGTSACTACRQGIRSAYTDVDAAFGGNNKSALVAGSSFSCYIPGGWGMMPTGVVKTDNTLEFSASECAVDTYGVADVTFGLQATPCKVRHLVLVTVLVMRYALGTVSAVVYLLNHMVC
jgi:hypothetical protein